MTQPRDSDPEPDGEDDAQPPVRGTHRHWLFTENNPVEGIPDLYTFGPHAIYVCVGEEVGDNGTYHYQGYVQFDQPVRLSHVHSCLPRAKFFPEYKDSSPQKSRDYCGKIGPKHAAKRHTLIDFHEFGQLSGQGKRNDLNDIKRVIDEGGTLLDCFNAQFGSTVRYNKGITLYMNLTKKHRTEPPKILIFVGPTRTGKSRAAHALCPPDDTFYRSLFKWWDGYDGQSHVLWDEFYGNCCPYTELLRILDRYPLTGETKGSTVKLSFSTIMFTSNRHPSEWYNYQDLQVPPWGRENPLCARIRENGRIILTGPLHQALPQVLNAEEHPVADLAGRAMDLLRGYPVRALAHAEQFVPFIEEL